MGKYKQIQIAINRSAEDTSNVLFSNVNILNNTTASFTQELLNTILANQNKILAIANLLGITFNSDGSINSENYTTHTHGYVDDTISDTADGSGVTTSTNKITGMIV